MKVRIDFGRVLPGLLLAVAGLLSLVNLIYTAFLYSAVRGRLDGHAGAEPAASVSVS